MDEAAENGIRKVEGGTAGTGSCELGKHGLAAPPGQVSVRVEGDGPIGLVELRRLWIETNFKYRSLARPHMRYVHTKKSKLVQSN